jgi:hypothetical protein
MYEVLSVKDADLMKKSVKAGFEIQTELAGSSTTLKETALIRRDIC